MRSLTSSRWLRVCLGVSLLGTAASGPVSCGDDTSAPPGVSILLSSDGSHACAGAVRIKATVAEVGGDSTVRELDAAVAPEQLDCDFDIGVAEALYALLIGEIATGKAHIVTVALFDSTGLQVAAGGSAPFEASPSREVDPVVVELTRVAPLGTVLVDLMALPDFASSSGTLEIAVLAGVEPIGSRRIPWSADSSLKRPLRISGLAGIGLRLATTLRDGSDTELASRITDPFSLGSSPSDAFVTPALNEM